MQHSLEAVAATPHPKLEVEARRNLNVARAVARTNNLAKERGSNLRHRIATPGAIEGVEEIRAQLETGGFIDCELLLHAEVSAINGGAAPNLSGVLLSVRGTRAKAAGFK